MYLFLIFAFYIAQLFIVKPGSDVTGNFGVLKTYSFMGMSYSALMCILIIGYSIWMLFRKGGLNKGKYTANIVCIFMYILLGDTAGLASGYPGGIDYIVKLVLPFVVFYYMECIMKEKEVKAIPNMILIINIIMLAQIGVCKALTGHFSASTYYTYLDIEEYFGYYNSPHPLSALLGLLSVWNIYNVLKSRKAVINLLLFAVNIVVIVLLGVRTYMAAVGAAMIVLAVRGVLHSKYRAFTPFVVAFLVFVAVLIYTNMDVLFAGTRLDPTINKTDVTSGRNARWLQDLKYIEQNYNFLEILFGRGFQAIYYINLMLGNGYINSLNCIIDVLADNGVIGFMLLTVAYARIIKICMTKNYQYVQIGILMFLLVGMMLNNLLPYVTIISMAVIMLLTIKYENRCEATEGVTYKGVLK